MKALGIVRNMDQLGRLVIPKEVRRSHGWEPGQPMEMFLDGDRLVVQAYRNDEKKEKLISNLKSAANTKEYALALNEAIAYLEGK